jgi:hypothetical protein
MSFGIMHPPPRPIPAHIPQAARITYDAIRAVQPPKGDYTTQERLTGRMWGLPHATFTRMIGRLMPEERSQLRMGLALGDGVADPALPDGYQLRTFRRGDENAWIALLETGDFNGWDHERLRRMLTRGQPLDGRSPTSYVTTGCRTIAAPGGPGWTAQS